MGFDDFDFLEAIDPTEDMPEETPSRKRRRPVESAKTLKAKEPTPSATRTLAPTQSSRLVFLPISTLPR